MPARKISSASGQDFLPASLNSKAVRGMVICICTKWVEIFIKETRLSICKELLSLLASYPVFSFSKQVVQASKKQIIGCRCCCQVWHLRTESCIASVRIRQEQTTRNKYCLHRVHCGHLDATLWQRFGCDHPCVRAKGCSSREIGSKERLLFLPVPFRPKSVRGGTDNVIIVRKSKHSVSRPKNILHRFIRRAEIPHP